MGRDTLLACSLVVALSAPLAAASPSDGSLKLRITDGRPVVDGVYVNGHGPYRFLLDTGATLNHVEFELAASIGLAATFHTPFSSPTGVASTSGFDGARVRLGPVSAEGQVFLFAGMEAAHELSADIQGVL